MLLGWLLLGDQGLLRYWQSLLLVGGVTGVLAGGWLAKRVRLRHGLLAFYARLMNNHELNWLVMSCYSQSTVERNRTAANGLQVTREQ